MLGIGVDLIALDRIEKTVSRSADRFARKILSEDELNQLNDAPDPISFLAKRFAVKEAVAKALGTGLANGVSWRDIALSHDELGKPVVSLFGGAKARFDALGASSILVSLSDDAGLVIASAHLS